MPCHAVPADRQTGRQTDRQRGTETGRQTDIYIYIYMCVYIHVYCAGVHIRHVLFKNLNKIFWSGFAGSRIWDAEVQMSSESGASKQVG